MIVRKAGVDDVHRIMAIHGAAIREICSRDYPRSVIDAWLAQRQPMKHLQHVEICSVWIAEDDNEAHGFGGVDLVMSRVESLFVDPFAGRQGVASHILRKLEDEARGAGCNELSLDSSFSALGFYQAKGFKPTGERTYLDLGNGVALEGVAMIKLLET